MVADRLAAHGQAQALAGRCPRCAERLSHRQLFRGRPCRHCGARLSEVALGAREVADDHRQRGLLHLGAICLGVALAHVIVGWVPLLASAVMLLVAVWLRFGILYPLTTGLSPSRRGLTRWTARLLVGCFLAATLVVSELLLLFGPVGVAGKALVGAVQVAASAAIVTAYVRWQVRREQHGRAPGWWEWGLLGTAMGGLAGTVTGLVLALILAVSSFEYLASFLVH